MAIQPDIDKARERLQKEFDEVKENMGQVHVAFDAVRNAGPEDNLHDLLHDLEKAAKDVRDGGVIGSGANAHRRALDDYQKLTGN